MRCKTIKDISINNLPSKEGDITAFNTIVHIVNGTPMDCLAKSYKYILQLEQENTGLKKQNEFLMTRDNKCQMLEQVFGKLNNNLINSIKSITNKLLNKEVRVENGRVINPINDYRIVRLKGIRTKCKELLDILKEVE